MDHTAAPRADVRCPVCEAPVLTGDAFCEACGHPLGAPSCTSCGAPAVDADGYCERCGLRQPTGRDHTELALDNGTAGVTDKGLRRSRNEDAMALLSTDTQTIVVVCDGVGSSPRADEASAVAVETASAALARGLSAEEAFNLAGRAVGKLATSVDDAPACTYVSAVVEGGRITLGWAGDSRAYWLSPGVRPAAKDPTVDTQPVDADPTAGIRPADPAATVDADPAAATPPVDADSTAATRPVGTLPPAGTRPAETGPPPGVRLTGIQLTEDDAAPTGEITAWLGADYGDVRPHVRVLEPEHPGLLLVCSDGLWRYLDGYTFPPTGSPRDMARAMLRHALDSGGQDNVTIVLIPLGDAHG
ncbi:protein phosphatase 2C domain-containing protein [Nonomuraea sp. NEAU-A123]|uniref:protein phosphatase 2C domain-containing protein n=1 Tax=Nonomuraea sp. NEAU-A123 TaxID=2839649 RepID=UPI001BE4DC38|nr:protein phosphatase 2C domain-containing protein [Nonomuraea sp. NEAU-A123]MBT2229352.1 protein phosphatase 2C domain-containing protein [Nonomuraea sp. NEAU-A123]